MNKDITEITELSVIESSVSMQNGMKNSGDVARHNRERTKKIHSDNEKSAKKIQEKRIAKIRQFSNRVDLLRNFRLREKNTSTFIRAGSPE